MGFFLMTGEDRERGRKEDGLARCSGGFWGKDARGSKVTSWLVALIV